MKKLLSLMCILMVVGCAGPQGNRPFAKRKQAINDAQKRFQAADVDDNGSLSRDEFSKSQAAKRAADPDKLFNSADTNGDGTLTFSELTQAIRKLQSNRR